MSYLIFFILYCSTIFCILVIYYILQHYILYCSTLFCIVVLYCVLQYYILYCRTLFCIVVLYYVLVGLLYWSILYIGRSYICRKAVCMSLK